MASAISSFSRARSRLELLDAGLQLAQALGGALGLALQVVLLDLEAVQHGALGRLLIAQRLQLVGGLGLGAQRLGLAPRSPAPAFSSAAASSASSLVDLALRLLPAQVQDDGVELADLGGQLLVAPRLPGLALQALDLRVELAQDVVEARQIALRRLEAQLRLVAAAVQAGDAGRILQDAAALLGLGIDELADLPLPHQRRRAGAGGGVLEQDAHVARAHLPAVDAVGRARLALDAARHLERVAGVELGRCLVAPSCR